MQKDVILFNLAGDSLDLAMEFLEVDTKDAMWKDLTSTRALLMKIHIDEESVKDSFAALTNMSYNVETANTLFRFVVICSYWIHSLRPSTAVNFAETACRVYKRSTMYRGYRTTLLTACQRNLEYGILEHSEGEQDYPPVECMLPSQELIESVGIYWKTELKSIPAKSENTEKSLFTSESFLSNSNECQELFGFGDHIIDRLIKKD